MCVSGMANGTNKPGYISSFMSFLESQDIEDPDDPKALPRITSASGRILLLLLQA